MDFGVEFGVANGVYFCKKNQFSDGNSGMDFGVDFRMDFGVAEMPLYTATIYEGISLTFSECFFSRLNPRPRPFLISGNSCLCFNTFLKASVGSQVLGRLSSVDGVGSKVAKQTLHPF